MERVSFDDRGRPIMPKHAAGERPSEVAAAAVVAFGSALRGRKHLGRSYALSRVWVDGHGLGHEGGDRS